MKLALKLWIGFAVAGSLLAPAHAQSRIGNAVCAAFSVDGDFAKARIERSSLRIEVTRPSASPISLTMPLTLSGDACHAFFSQDGELLAVSIEDQVHPRAQVQIAVAHARTGKWLRDKPLPASLAEDARGPLAGFMGATHTLFVMSGGTYFSDEERSLLYPVFMELPKGAVHTGLFGYSGPAFTTASGAIGPSSQRVWFPAKQDACGLRSMLLDSKADAKAGASFKGSQLRADGCVQTELVVGASSDLLIAGFSKANTFVLATMQVDSRKLQTFTLEAKGREGFLQSRGSAVAPGAGATAIELIRFDDTRSGLKRAAHEVVILTTNPVGLAATLRLAEDSELLAIGKLGGELSVAVADKRGKISILKAK